MMLSQKLKTILHCTILALVILAVGVGGTVGYLAYDAYKHPEKALSSTKGPVSTLDVSPDSNSEPVVTLSPLDASNDMFSVLFLGHDEGAGRPKNEAGHTDVMMLCSINLKTKEINLLSIPRDTITTVRKLNADGSTKSVVYDRINTAYLWGGYSADNAVDTVERLLGVPIDNYVLVDMTSVAVLTDAIGGVTVEALNTIENAGVVKGQTYTLSGWEALSYVRERHVGQSDGSDIQRTARQRQFVIAAAQKIKESDPLKLIGPLYKMTKYYETNMTYQQLAALASMLKNTDVSAIKTSIVPGTGIPKGQPHAYCWKYDEVKLAEWRDSVYKAVE